MLDTIGVSPAIRNDIQSLERDLENEYIKDTEGGDTENEDTEDGDTEDEGIEDDLPTLSIGHGSRLSEKVETWRSVLRYELAEEKRFTVANAPVIDLEEILQSPDYLFEEDVWESLPKQTQEDLKESCRSLAAYCPTASVIMILRSIEYILREWYKQELDEDEADDPWGPVLGKLRSALNDRGEDPDVLSNLDYLRRKRNEVNHPNRSPSQHEAAVTIAMASETITAMMEHIEIEDELEIND